MAFNPAADPITFLVYYFLFVVPIEGLIGIIKIGLITSVFLYPFAYTGNYICSRLNERSGRKILFNILTVTFLMFFFFWIVSRIYGMIFSGLPFFSGDILTLIWTFILGTIVGFLFVMLGNYLFTKINERWKMPRPIALYITVLIICIVFWSILELLFLAVYLPVV